MYKVELEHSKISGKRKVTLNWKLLECFIYTYNFMFSFNIDKHSLSYYYSIKSDD